MDQDKYDTLYVEDSGWVTCDRYSEPGVKVVTFTLFGDGPALFEGYMTAAVEDRNEAAPLADWLAENAAVLAPVYRSRRRRFLNLAIRYLRGVAEGLRGLTIQDQEDYRLLMRG